jgi:Xaa-Pro aminopeptidase
VGSGPRTAFFRGATQQATENRIGKNEFIILDIHPMVELYIVDFALPIFLGTPNWEQQKLIDCWHDTVDTLWADLKPGNQVGEICRNAVKVFARHGFANFGLPAFGHGLGTCARTRPFLNLKSQEILQQGMVFALNTHLYKPGVGGARQEYPVLITETGSEPLSKLPPRVFRL